MRFILLLLAATFCAASFSPAEANCDWKICRWFEKHVKPVVKRRGEDTGVFLENARKATEKAGRDINKAGIAAKDGVVHFLKEATKFDLSCKLPVAMPADLDEPYRNSCGGHFNTYRNDIDACNKAGGVSMIAAGTAGASSLAVPVVGAITYSLAKLAFEFCQGACRSQKHLLTCVNDIDSLAVVKQQQSQDLKLKNDDAATRQKLFSCIDDAYTTEKLVALDKIFDKCSGDKSCNVHDPAYASQFDTDAQKEIAAIDDRRTAALEKFQNGDPISSLDYGPNIKSAKLLDILITSGKDELSRVCAAKSPILDARISVNPNAVTAIEVSVLNDNKAYGTKSFEIDKTGKAVASFGLANLPQGRWTVRVTSNGELLGESGFVYRPEIAQ